MSLSPNSPPAIPFSGGAPYDSVQLAVNAARARLNDRLDTLSGVSGKILGTPTAFSQQLVNNAWRCLQHYLGNKGYTLFNNMAIIYSLPVAANPDPAVPCVLSWAGFFDGVTQWPTPALPPDLVAPISMWERYSGQNMPFPDQPMEKMLERLPSWPKSTWMGRWWYAGDSILVPGGLQVEDFLIRYIRFKPDFADTAGPPAGASLVRWYNQPLPLVRGSDALGFLIAAETDLARENGLADEFRTLGYAAADVIYNFDARANQRVNLRRQSRSGRLEVQNGYSYL